MVEPESTQILQGVLETYIRFEEYPRALLVAMQLNDKAKCEEVFNACDDPSVSFNLKVPFLCNVFISYVPG